MALAARVVERGSCRQAAILTVRDLEQRQTQRAPLLGRDAQMVEMRTEDLLALNRTAWRPYFQASLPAFNANNSSGPFPLTVGVKHVSDFVERRNAAV